MQQCNVIIIKEYTEHMELPEVQHCINKYSIIRLFINVEHCDVDDFQCASLTFVVHYDCGAKRNSGKLKRLISRTLFNIGLVWNYILRKVGLEINISIYPTELNFRRIRQIFSSV